MNRVFVEAQIPGLNEEKIILAQERLDAVLLKLSHILPRIKGLYFLLKIFFHEIDISKKLTRTFI